MHTGATLSAHQEGLHCGGEADLRVMLPPRDITKCRSWLAIAVDTLLMLPLCQHLEKLQNGTSKGS